MVGTLSVMTRRGTLTTGGQIEQVMKKNTSPTTTEVTSNSDTVLLASGYILLDYEIQHLEGQLLTLLESLGLREGQEKAAKDMFRGIYYRGVYNGRHIRGPQVAQVRIENEGYGGQTPKPPMA